MRGHRFAGAPDTPARVEPKGAARPRRGDMRRCSVVTTHSSDLSCDPLPTHRPCEALPTHAGTRCCTSGVSRYTTASDREEPQSRRRSHDASNLVPGVDITVVCAGYRWRAAWLVRMNPSSRPLTVCWRRSWCGSAVFRLGHRGHQPPAAITDADGRVSAIAPSMVAARFHGAPRNAKWAAPQSISHLNTHHDRMLLVPPSAQKPGSIFSKSVRWCARLAR